MEINFTKYGKDLTFGILKERDVFYYCDDEDKIPTLYMVIVPVDYEDCFGGYSTYNCVCLNSGFLDYAQPDASVKLCKATINIEG